MTNLLSLPPDLLRDFIKKYFGVCDQLALQLTCRRLKQLSSGVSVLVTNVYCENKDEEAECITKMQELVSKGLPIVLRRRALSDKCFEKLIAISCDLLSVVIDEMFTDYKQLETITCFCPRLEILRFKPYLITHLPEYYLGELRELRELTAIHGYGMRFGDEHIFSKLPAQLRKLDIKYWSLRITTHMMSHLLTRFKQLESLSMTVEPANRDVFDPLMYYGEEMESPVKFLDLTCKNWCQEDTKNVSKIFSQLKRLTLNDVEQPID